MTLPDERFRALLQSEEFLRALMDPKLTPRVPKEIRTRAMWCLRHYPSFYDLKRIERDCPDVLTERMEDVTKMFKQYEMNKND